MSVMEKLEEAIEKLDSSSILVSALKREFVAFKKDYDSKIHVPRKPLEELMERFPKYRRSGICSREIGEFKDWFEKLKRVYK